MFGGRNQYAFFHQAGRVADAGNILANCLNFKTVKVNAAEDNARVRRRGQDAQFDRRSRVQADTLALYSYADCLFLYQQVKNKRGNGNLACGKTATHCCARFIQNFM